MLAELAFLPSFTEPAPETRASALIDMLPGNSIVSKTTWVTVGTGLSALAISKELYVANEETVILVAFLIFATFIGRTVSGPYKEWADGQIEVSEERRLRKLSAHTLTRILDPQKISGILNGARKEHTNAVQSRIDSVNEQRDVVDITKSLFAVAKVSSIEAFPAQYCLADRVFISHSEFRKPHNSRENPLSSRSEPRLRPRSSLCLTAGCDTRLRSVKPSRSSSPRRSSRRSWPR